MSCQSLHKTMVEDKSWYFEKIIDTFKNKDLIFNVKNGKPLCKKYLEKVHQELVAGPEWWQILVEKFFERGLSKKFYKVNFIFSFEPTSFL